MGVPHTSGNFGDLLDPRFQRIFHDQYGILPDMLPFVFAMAPNNGRDIMTWSQVGAFKDFPAFTGQVSYDNLSQGFDTTMTFLEFTSGFQVQRTLFDDDQYHIMDRKPTGLADAGQRTRQKHGARIFNNAFTNDTFFYNNSEGVALASNSHTTNSDDADTSSGFDNLITSPLSATAVAAARIQFVNLRDDRGNRFPVQPDEIYIPPDRYETAYEIVASMGKVDTANNNRNVHEGAYRVVEWNYMTDSNNWFMADSSLRKQMLFWVDRIPLEFAFMEDFDTFVGKWRAYMRYAMSNTDWRWLIGAQVS